ncbi:nucleotidyltransferase [Nitrospira sp.]|nr:nucleotidyltransferase [Nitrospira sp.]
MKALLLAAGVGKRLWAITQYRPKCLIEFGGKSLLVRHLETLASLGVRRTTIVVGYKQEMIRKAVGEVYAGVSLDYVVNDQYHRGSISSLWMARRSLDDDVVIMDADVLYHREIMRRLLRATHPTCLLMDESVKQTGEECMVVVRGGRVTALTKRMPSAYDYAGEGVGFLKVQHSDADQLVASLEAHIERDEWDMEYEDGLREFFSAVTVGHEKIGGLPWTEIDFPEDVEKATREILPKLD